MSVKCGPVRRTVISKAAANCRHTHSVFTYLTLVVTYSKQLHTNLTPSEYYKSTNLESYFKHNYRRLLS